MLRDDGYLLHGRDHIARLIKKEMPNFGKRHITSSVALEYVKRGGAQRSLEVAAERRLDVDYLRHEAVLAIGEFLLLGDAERACNTANAVGLTEEEKALFAPKALELLGRQVVYSRPEFALELIDAFGIPREQYINVVINGVGKLKGRSYVGRLCLPVLRGRTEFDDYYNDKHRNPDEEENREAMRRAEAAEKIFRLNEEELRLVMVEVLKEKLRRGDVRSAAWVAADKLSKSELLKAIEEVKAEARDTRYTRAGI